MESRRTTIVLDKKLYQEAKRRALEQDKTLRGIMDEALRAYLRGHPLVSTGRRGRFGVYRGKVRGTLRRETLYRDLLK